MTSTPYCVDDLIEDLRQKAVWAAEEANEGNAALSSVIAMPAVVPEETPEWEATELIEHYRKALADIATGAIEATKIAEAALAFEPPASRIIDGESF